MKEGGIPMSYFLGIDGGGTKTKVAVINDSGELLYIGQSGPSSIDTVSISDTIAAIETAAAPFFAEHPGHFVSGLFAGLGGIVTTEDCFMVESHLRMLSFVHSKTTIQARNDMENALYSGGLFAEGMALICGTGMVAFGIDAMGNHHKAGGWGYREGDYGSAFDLGSQALKHVIQAADGRIDNTAFEEEIAHRIGLFRIEDIQKVLDRYYGNRTLVASLAPIVTHHANSGNRHAKRIVETATHELAIAVDAVNRQLTLTNKSLVVVGSLGNSEGYFQEELHRRIHELDSSIRILSPLYDPAVAAANMAMRIE
jgi:N-acetylglucosamine kinase-like BadF-type ATPase